jgi:hypothetical protein
VSLEKATAALPDARVVHVVRDGRDVCLSWLGIWTGPANLALAAAEKTAWSQRTE